MRYLFIMILVFLSGCSVRMWDPPNYNQSLCRSAPACGNAASTGMPHIPLVQMNGKNV